MTELLIPKNKLHLETPSIITFVAFDIASFSAFFVAFMIDRNKQQAIFNQSSQLLDIKIGLINTLILITSGWLVALAVKNANYGYLTKTYRQLLMASLIGSMFSVFKIIEYWTKLSDGITPYSNDFFGYYFILTGIHFFHYIIGIFLLSIAAIKTARRTKPDFAYINWLKSVALYWHMVDVIWVFMFPILYLQGAK